MVSGPRSARASQSSLVLQEVMADLVGEDVAEHEPTETIVRPRHNARTLDRGSGGLEQSAIGRTKTCSHAPGRPRLVVKEDVSRRSECAEWQASTVRRSRHEFDTV